MHTLSNPTYTDKDIRVVRWQLGTGDVNMGGVLDRCAYGYPRIMLLNPRIEAEGKKKVNYEAISNLLWLTCPYLNEKIHQLEDRGYIEKITGLITSDIDFRARMSNAHAHFYFLRKTVYISNFKKEEPVNNLKLFNTGIAGIRDTGSLKCLHAQFCHYRICDENLAGYVVTRLLKNKINCDEVRCRNAHKKQ